MKMGKHRWYRTHILTRWASQSSTETSKCIYIGRNIAKNTRLCCIDDGENEIGMRWNEVGIGGIVWWMGEATDEIHLRRILHECEVWKRICESAMCGWVCECGLIAASRREICDSMEMVMVIPFSSPFFFSLFCLLQIPFMAFRFRFQFCFFFFSSSTKNTLLASLLAINFLSINFPMLPRFASRW